jgi:hypothetical protein
MQNAKCKMVDRRGRRTREKGTQRGGGVKSEVRRQESEGKSQEAKAKSDGRKRKADSRRDGGCKAVVQFAAR